MKLQTIIGLEIHVQLKTKSKMFCSCDNSGENQPPNTTVCPICMGNPGVLPVMNRQAVEWSVMTALALDCDIPINSKFDRKNYFYPDLPKGYQISQYDQPIGVKGFLEIEENGQTFKINITRLHLEEDAAKNFHSTDGQFTYVDYNRACTPLMEIVTEPDLRSPQQAKIFMQELRLMMRYLGVSDADMEKGHMRCDANVNLWELDENNEKITATPIVEIKNMNSFKALERALEYEIKRQTKEYKEFKTTIKDAPKSTRGWDDIKGVTVPQRTKEEAHDYRYFPEPDLPPLNFSPDAKNAIDVDKIRQMTPELPQAKIKRLEQECGLNKEDAKILAGDKELSEYAEKIFSELEEWVTGTGRQEGTHEEIWKKSCSKSIKTATNWLLNKLAPFLYRDNVTFDKCRVTPENFAEFITLIFENKINSAVAQKVLEIMYTTGKDPSNILEEKQLTGETSGNDLNKIINTVINENPEPVANYKKGKTTAIMFLVGQVMKITKGKSDPNNVKKILEDSLKK